MKYTQNNVICEIAEISNLYGLDESSVSQILVETIESVTGHQASVRADGAVYLHESKGADIGTAKPKKLTNGSSMVALAYRQFAEQLQKMSARQRYLRLKQLIAGASVILGEVADETPNGFFVNTFAGRCFAPKTKIPVSEIAYLKKGASLLWHMYSVRFSQDGQHVIKLDMLSSKLYSEYASRALDVEVLSVRTGFGQRMKVYVPSSTDGIEKSKIEKLRLQFPGHKVRVVAVPKSTPLKKGL